MENFSSLSFKLLVILHIFNLAIMFVERNLFNTVNYILIILCTILFIYLTWKRRTQHGTFFIITCLGFVFSVNLHHTYFFNSSYFITYIIYSIFLLYQIQYPKGTGYLFLSMFANILKIASPIVFAIFIFISLFPKVSINLLSQFTEDSDLQNESELNLDMRPGELSKLGLTKKIFFTARTTPFVKENASLYWRGTYLDQTSDGMHWFHPDNSRLDLVGDKKTKSSNILQDIILNSSANKILFGLDTPIKIHDRQSMPGKTFYQISSEMKASEENLSLATQEKYLQIPKVYDQRVLILARSIQRKNPRDTASELLKFFSTGFQYSLEPGKIGANSLAKFLFEKRIGFCEHYAASFASLMRLAGVPSRVVIGFQGGDLNPLNNYYIIRARDAHAWVEIWSSSDSTWLRYDPVQVVAPKRIELGAASFNSKKELGYFKQYKETLLFFANAFLTEISLIYFTKKWGYFVILFFILFTAFCLFISRKRAKDHNELKKTYLKFNKIMAKKGLKKSLSQGPMDFGELCRKQFPANGLLIQRFIQLYVELSYSKPKDTSLKFKEMKMILRELK